MKNIKCNTCNSVIEEKNIDFKNKILFCTTCNAYQSISGLNTMNALKESLKSKVEQPKNIEVIESESNSTLVIKPSLVPVLLSLIPILIFALAVFFLGGFNHMKFVESLPFVGGLLLIVHIMLLATANRKSITITDDLLTSSTKRYYKKSYTKKFSIDTQELAQLYVKSRKIGSGSDSSTVFDLRVKSINDEDQVMIEGHKNFADLFFIEQFIEEFLDIEDVIQSSEIPNVSTLMPSLSDVIKLFKNR